MKRIAFLFSVLSLSTAAHALDENGVSVISGKPVTCFALKPEQCAEGLQTLRRVYSSGFDGGNFTEIVISHAGSVSTTGGIVSLGYADSLEVMKETLSSYRGLLVSGTTMLEERALQLTGQKVECLGLDSAKCLHGIETVVSVYLGGFSGRFDTIYLGLWEDTKTLSDQSEIMLDFSDSRWDMEEKLSDLLRQLR